MTVLIFFLLYNVNFSTPSRDSLSSQCYVRESCQPAFVGRTSDGVDFYGFIDSDSAHRAAVLLRTGDALHIWSNGGERVAAIELGNTVIDKNVRVVADSWCVSACALYVFLPARHKSLVRGAYVLFHSPAAMWQQFTRNSPRKVDSDQIGVLQRNAKLEAQLYRSGWAAQRWSPYWIALHTLQDPDYLSVESNQLGDLQMANKRYDFVAFSLSALLHYGVPGIDQYWIPQSARWRAGPTGGVKRIAWVDGGDTQWCAAAPGAQGPEPGM